MTLDESRPGSGAQDSAERQALHILLISSHYINGTSEGLCAARAAVALASRGHRVTVVANDDLRSEFTEPAVEHRDVKVVRVAARTTALVRCWQWLSDRRPRFLPLRVALAVFNLRHLVTAKEWGWVLAASDRAEQILRKEAGSRGAIDVVFSRLNPVGSHHAARRLVRRQPALPWCAYFSDPWPHHLYPEPFNYAAGRRATRRGALLLKDLFEAADTLLFPSARLSRYLASFVWSTSGSGADDSGQRAKNKLMVAAHCGPPNCRAAELARGGQTQPRANPVMIIRHAGFLMKERKVDGLFEALRSLPDAVRAQVRVEFMGRTGSQTTLSAPDLVDTVSFVPAESPKDSFEWMGKADVALLVETDLVEGIFMPSKLADYAFLGRPILAMSPKQGTVSDALAKGGGLRAGPLDAVGLKNAIETLHAAWTKGSLSELAPTAEFAQQFDAETVGALIEAALITAIDNRDRQGR